MVLSGLCLVIFVSLFLIGNAQVFDWYREWGRCERNTTECCNQCVQRRNIYCAVRGTSRQVPERYCEDVTPARETYLTTQDCKESECVQDCVTGDWSQWSFCSKTCGNLGFEMRRRSVLQGPVRGRPCPVLIQTTTCRNVSILPVCPGPNTTDPPISIVYTWRLGSWSACRNFSASDTGDGSVDCGLGLRQRIVNCVATNGSLVDEINCKSSPKEPTPSNVQACNLPCDCQVSSWSEWGNCSIACIANRTLLISGSGSGNGSDSAVPDPDEPHRLRMRTVLRSPKFGGEDCPHLQEPRSCDLDKLPDCPNYQWATGLFQACEVESPDAVCGFGQRTRIVICSEGFSNFSGQLDPNLPSITDGFCTGDLTLPGAPPASNPVKPVTFQPCYIPCPEDCQLGQWEAFSDCSKSCGEGGIRIRTRPVLAVAKNDGKECDATNQSIPCNAVNCTSWSVTEYSTCFPNINSENCGNGNRHRSVDCVNALGFPVNLSECAYQGPEPEKDDNCYIPCPGDCVLSFWTEWTDCPLGCPEVGSIHTRNRTVEQQATSVNGKCVDNDELKQRRQCTILPCMSDIWRTESWENCQLQGNDSALCGEGVGEQVRNVFCEQQFQGFGSRPGDNCDKNVMPPANRSCTINCPVDCVMSDWSTWLECSATCGGGMRSRSRFITQTAAFGGEECPENNDGIITASGTCSNNPCYTYKWETGDWSNCTLFFPSDTCGPGFQTRSVGCRRSDETEVATGICSETLFVAEPGDQQNCYIACGDECVFDSWSPFGPCSQKCGITAGSKNRTRGVLSDGSTVTDFKDDCPHIQQSDLIDIEPCNHLICLDYNWVSSEWFSCILNSGDCGLGSQSRYIQCQRSDGVAVSPTLCIETGRAIPNRSQECSLPCPVDCLVTPWSEYSRCCGGGLRSRVRTVVKEDSDGGRPCSFVDLTQSAPCISQCQWVVGDWDTCSDMSCGSGNGTLHRSVRCHIDSSIGSDSDCSSVSAKPLNQTDCDRPCSPRECAFSVWSEWSDCTLTHPSIPESLRCANGATIQKRTRTLEQVGSGGCGSTNDEKGCRLPKCLTYKWTVGSWGDCMFDSTTTTSDCSAGLKTRRVVCESETFPAIIDATACNQTDKPIEQMNCSLLCTTDCGVSNWSPWSSCSASCGQGIHERTRKVIAGSKDGGQDCPSLHQTKLCAENILPCYNYSIQRSKWSECSAGDGVCGVGERTRTVECLQHDGLEAQQFACCLNEFCRDTIEGTDQDDIAENIHTSEECRVPCPGACQWAEWSTWSPCVKNCSSQGNNGTQTRSRGILIPGLEGSLPCHGEFLENRTCYPSTCFIYKWVTGNWTEDDNRTVDCYQFVGDEMIRKVDGGCDPSTKPPHIRGCFPPCGPHMNCTGEIFQCKCEAEYEMDSLNTCFPPDGCLDNSHCPMDYTECNTTTDKCDCAPGHSVPPRTTNIEVCTVHECNDPTCGENEECDTTTGDCQCVQNAFRDSEDTSCKFECLSNEDCRENERCNDIRRCVCVEVFQSDDGTTDCRAPFTGSDDDDPPYWAWIILAVGVVLILIIILIIVVCKRRGYKSYTFRGRQSFEAMDHFGPTAATESTTWIQDPNPRPYSQRHSSDESIHKAPLEFDTETETDFTARRASPSDDSDLDIKKTVYDTDTDAEFGRYDAAQGKRNSRL